MPEIMPYDEWKRKKDEKDERKKERNRKKAKKIYERTKTYTVRVYKDSEIMQAIERAASDAGKQPGRYLRQAMMEKLQRDGYIAEIPEDSDPEE